MPTYDYFGLSTDNYQLSINDRVLPPSAGLFCTRKNTLSNNTVRTVQPTKATLYSPRVHPWPTCYSSKDYLGSSILVTDAAHAQAIPPVGRCYSPWIYTHHIIRDRKYRSIHRSRGIRCSRRPNRHAVLSAAEVSIYWQIPVSKWSISWVK